MRVIYRIALVLLVCGTLVGIGIAGWNRMWADPGGNLKYDINVDHFMIDNVSDQDSIGYLRALNPAVLEDVLFRGEVHDYLYDPHTGDTVGRVRDSIVDVRFSSQLLEENGSRKVVFCTFLKALYCYDLRDGSPPYLADYSILSTAILFDGLSSRKCIDCLRETENIYFDTIINPNDEIFQSSFRASVQHLIVNYSYDESHSVFQNKTEFWNRLDR